MPAVGSRAVHGVRRPGKALCPDMMHAATLLAEGFTPNAADAMTARLARSKRIIIHRDLKPGNLMLGGIPFDTDDASIAQVR